MRLLMQICRKHTKEPLSSVHDIEALTVFDAVRQIEKLSGVKVDGVYTYVDYAVNTYGSNNDTTA